jgi:hypothetical protein
VALEFPRLTSSACVSAQPSDACYESKNEMSGLAVESMRLDDGDEYKIEGDEITLGSGGITASPASESSGPAGDVIGLPIRLGASQTWSIAGREGGSVGENGLLVDGGLSGSGDALTVNLSSDPVLYLEGDMEVGPVTIDGANDGDAGAPNGLVGFFGELDSQDGGSVSLSHIALEGIGAIGALTSNASDMYVGSGVYPTAGIEASTATFDSASEVVFQVAGANTSAGADYSQLVSRGAIGLGGSSLSVEVTPSSAQGSCPSLTTGNTYVLVSTTGTLSGSFGNAPQGSELPVRFAKSCLQTSRYVRIAYHESGAVQTVTATVVPPLGVPPSPPENIGILHEPLPVPTPENATTKYEIPTVPGVSENVRKDSEEQVARAEAERKAKEEKVSMEEEAEAQGVIARLEQEERESNARQCVVPSLKGDSLAKARSVLRKAHCRLGKVSRPGGRYQGDLVVIRQRIAHGRRLPNHTPVAVTLGVRASHGSR